MRLTNKSELIERITQYLANCGLFNPELMEHKKVRELLIACRAALRASRGEGGLDV